jgi:hypothetical protein
MVRFRSLPLVVAALLVAPAALADEPASTPAPDAPAVSGDATVTFANAYVFRGFQLGRDSLVIQPAANVGYRGFTLGLWSNIDTKQHDTDNFVPTTPGERQLNEVDLSLAYEQAFGPVTLSGGWLYYGTSYAPETEEVFLAASFDVPGSPTLTVFRDIRSFAGWYASLGLSHELALPAALAVEVSASAGFAALDDGDYSALHDGTGKVRLTIPLPGGFAVRPWAAYSFPLSSEAEDEALIESAFVGAVDFTRAF